MDINIKNVRMASKHLEALELLLDKYGREEYKKAYPNCVNFYLALKKLDAKAHKLAEDICNGYIQSDDIEDKKQKQILNKLDKMINTQYLGVFVNLDPRGYSLKIDTSVNELLLSEGIVLYRDMGNYGILAPDFS